MTTPTPDPRIHVHHMINGKCELCHWREDEACDEPPVVPATPFADSHLGGIEANLARIRNDLTDIRCLLIAALVLIVFMFFETFLP